MPKFRKKPVVIEGEQWPWAHNVAGWAARGVFHQTILAPDHPAFKIIASARPECRPKGEWAWMPTLEGGHIVYHGDWIMTGVKGERYPIKPYILEATHEPVEE